MSPTFQWRQTEGPSLDASPFNQKSLKFTLPSVAVETTIAFELTLTDAQGNQAQDTIRITIKPTPLPHNLPPPYKQARPLV
ncbi:PKD domain-containing protein [Vibrio vulnificus]|uniref:PKD domain-containing protein n=1 Tax=Vibrio vulnificus TaxID=672 RepID=UPI00374E1A08